MITLFDQWRWQNNSFLEDEVPTRRIAGSISGAYILQPNVILRGIGFGLPDQTSFFDIHDGVDLLWQRYVDHELFKQCEAIQEASPGSGAHTYLFRRSGKGPRAGQCLIAFTIAKQSASKPHLSIYSRAGEVTMAMLRDMYFLRALLEDRLGITPKKLENMPITWLVSFAHQNRYYAPVFLYETAGRDAVTKWSRPKAGDTEWADMCKRFYADMIERRINLTGTPGRWQKFLLQAMGR